MFKNNTVLPAKIPPNLLRPLAYRVISKKHGLNIKTDGLQELARFIGHNFGIGWKNDPLTTLFLENFAKIWKQQDRNLFIDAVGVKDVINELKEREKVSNNSNNKKENVVPTNNANMNSNILGMLQNHNNQKNDIIIDEMEIDERSDIPMHNLSLNIDSEATLNMEPIEELDNNNNNRDQNEYSDDDELDWEDYFKIINAHEQQKFVFDSYKSQFKFLPNKKNGLSLPKIDDKLNLFKNRYHLIKDRLSRNEDFQNTDEFNPLQSIIQMNENLSSTDKIDNNVTLTPIKNLIGNDGKNFLILGSLYISPRGSWCMEDPSGTINLDITQALPTPGMFYVPGCFVIAEGIYFTANDTFHVTSMTHPPGEKRVESLAAIGNLDFLGIHGLSNPNYIARLDNDLKIRLHFLERELTDNTFVILGSDIFLDNLSIFDALRKLFQKLNENPPTVLILPGSFSKVPIFPSMGSNLSAQLSSSTQYKNNFDTLANLLSQYENLINETVFIFIPGPNDPWNSTISLGATSSLPQSNIPIDFTTKINRVVKKVHWGSNPTRIAYLSQEIVLFRDDIRDRLIRHSVEFPMIEERKYEENKKLRDIDENKRNNNMLTVDPELVTDDDNAVTERLSQLSMDKPPEHIQESRKLVKTLFDQGHLSPFTTDIRPVIWDMDHTLTMYPIPSTLILCDTSCGKFDVTYNGSKTINVGSFATKRCIKYSEYSPSLRRAIEQELFF